VEAATNGPTNDAGRALVDRALGVLPAGDRLADNGPGAAATRPRVRGRPAGSGTVLTDGRTQLDNASTDRHRRVCRVDGGAVAAARWALCSRQYTPTATAAAYRQ